MHKKGITEEVAKKRSRKNVKSQVGCSAGGMAVERDVGLRRDGRTGANL